MNLEPGMIAAPDRRALAGQFRSLDGVTGIDDNLSTSTSLEQKIRDEFQRKAD
jgi:hypothetical protein